ncbi:twin-arginine translocase TatA/TatE family subunit [bacterium]|jgi:sec-independent protein translocase protein TatA|nr:twin-arginine translocase TatA/TatE family subunit [bacterium]
MFGVSGEHLLILGIILLIMGPRRLPELGNTLGKAIRNFKDAIAGVEEASYRKLEDSPSQQARSQSSDPSPNQTSAEPQKSTS